MSVLFWFFAGWGLLSFVGLVVIGLLVMVAKEEGV